MRAMMKLKSVWERLQPYFTLSSALSLLDAVLVALFVSLWLFESEVAKEWFRTIGLWRAIFTVLFWLPLGEAQIKLNKHEYQLFTRQGYADMQARLKQRMPFVTNAPRLIVDLMVVIVFAQMGGLGESLLLCIVPLIRLAAIENMARRLVWIQAAFDAQIVLQRSKIPDDAHLIADEIYKSVETYQRTGD